ncbi:hypothetical protein BGW42_007850 [Actinomortierella wolfii]|nr:hypothetical protein BGW42_007850 [Actinomortierella wolfii]
MYMLGNSGDFSIAALNTATGPNMMESTPIKWNFKLQHGSEYKLHVLDGSKVLDPISMPKKPVESYPSPVSGIFGDGTTSYMLFQTGRLEKYSSNYQLSALALFGPSAGILMDVPNNITVSDNIGYSPEADGNSGGLSIALRWIIGLVSCCTILCVIQYIRGRRQPKVIYVKDPRSQGGMVTTEETTTKRTVIW